MYLLAIVITRGNDFIRPAPALAAFRSQGRHIQPTSSGAQRSSPVKMIGHSQGANRKNRAQLKTQGRKKIA